MADAVALALAAGAGLLGGAMNALAGGGTFATLPALIAIGLPGTAANATSNVALLPGAGASAWSYRAGLAPLGGISVARLAAITFAGGLIGSLLLILTPTRTFDVVIPWLLLYATVLLAFGPRAARWLHARATIGPRTLVVVQVALGIYGGYFGGGVGLMMTAAYGLLAGIGPQAMMAPRTLMLAVANLAATGLFVASGLVDWAACLPMLAGALIGGWLGAIVGKRLPAPAVRLGTLAVSVVTTTMFFARAYS
ncbi:sulfite exporter TauE/SafE family protein [Sphingomonas profundi]|uniref:sulfite exporter TauE/SafE family protein n=1 Tax=Alterirhizorhabdus profundi TaxID=2681549 RepID=UPI00241114FE|nr:sulfite exporter TauE/SafE family protein [Sphingomonas profundi]